MLGAGLKLAIPSVPNMTGCENNTCLQVDLTGFADSSSVCSIFLPCSVMVARLSLKELVGVQISLRQLGA